MHDTSEDLGGDRTMSRAVIPELAVVPYGISYLILRWETCDQWPSGVWVNVETGMDYCDTLPPDAVVYKPAHECWC